MLIGDELICLILPALHEKWVLISRMTQDCPRRGTGSSRSIPTIHGRYWFAGRTFLLLISVLPNQPRSGSGGGLELDVDPGRCRKIPYEPCGMDLSGSREDKRVRYPVGPSVTVDHYGITLIGHHVASVLWRGHCCNPLYHSTGKIRGNGVGVSHEDEIALGDGGVIGCHCFALQRIGDETPRAQAPK